MGDHGGITQNESDDISMKIILNLTRHGGTFGTLRLDENSFFQLYEDTHLIWILNLLMQSMVIAHVFEIVKKLQIQVQ